MGIGTDIVRRARLEAAVTRWGRPFLDRIFTPREQQYCLKFRNSSLHLAGRFAVKEALFKALGSGWGRGVRWNEIETTNAPSGQPRVAITGRVKAIFDEQGGEAIFVTISHDTDYSIGHVIITRKATHPP